MARTGHRLEHQETRHHPAPYHTIQIQVGDQIVTAADPLPDDALTAITKIRAAVH